jgi:hypothetical protein
MRNKLLEKGSGLTTTPPGEERRFDVCLSSPELPVTLLPEVDQLRMFVRAQEMPQHLAKKSTCPSYRRCCLSVKRDTASFFSFASISIMHYDYQRNWRPCFRDRNIFNRCAKTFCWNMLATDICVDNMNVCSLQTLDVARKSKMAMDGIFVEFDDTTGRSDRVCAAKW